MQLEDFEVVTILPEEVGIVASLAQRAQAREFAHH